MKVYLCGPINGRSDDDCKAWREAAKAVLPDTLQKRTINAYIPMHHAQEVRGRP
jgi:hypothetical protein